ncbi:MAG: alpha-rhamnosidase [Clostridia bacterium]|nr:alpha-rhamnosidase [Clostridia bacterium]
MKSMWMWYYGDFEMYHSQRVHLRRMERDVCFPAFWKLPEAYTNVMFKKNFTLEETEVFRVTAKGVGFVKVNNKKYSFDKDIELTKGEYEIIIAVSNLNGLPCAYVEGKTIVSNNTWLSDCYDYRWTPAGTNEKYSDKSDDPNVFKFSYRELIPVSVKKINGGVLYDYGEETFARLKFNKIGAGYVFYGETEQEALDTENSYTYHCLTEEDEGILKEGKAFRYVFIPESKNADVDFTAYYEYIPHTKKGEFKCSDEELTKIWEVAAHTFELNSREFYLDGIKRDRWVWSGDSYQSYFINRYLFFDEDIVRRTITCLGSKGEIKLHINTIMDYTFYWIMSIYDYYEMTGDIEFVRNIYPRVKAYMNFIMSRLDENGFASKQDNDWIFIDWADIDKEGAVCAEQMLLMRCIESYIRILNVLGEKCGEYKEKFLDLKEKVNLYFWNEEKGAFIDSFKSGKNNVSRHANIFALLFGYAAEDRRKKIIENVILNDEVEQIKTPYFKFYELEALCNVERYDEVIKRMKEYWGAMLKIGATSFWEEFDVNRPWQEQLGNYNLKYAMSLCHAWGSSPIYLIGRYILGIRPTGIGYETFEVKPVIDCFEDLEAKIPIKNGFVSIAKHNNVAEILSDRDGGTLINRGCVYQIKRNEPVILKL